MLFSWSQIVQDQTWECDKHTPIVIMYSGVIGSSNSQDLGRKRSFQERVLQIIITISIRITESHPTKKPSEKETHVVSSRKCSSANPKKGAHRTKRLKMGLKHDL